MRYGRIPFLAGVLLLVAAGGAQADHIDDFIKAQMKSQNIPGLSLAVVKGGEIIRAEGYGLADMKLRIPARADTVYKIASVSKQFIATGIMLLVQEGRLSVDDPISRFLEGTPTAWKGIGCRDFAPCSRGSWTTA